MDKQASVPPLFLVVLPTTTRLPLIISGNLVVIGSTTRNIISPWWDDPAAINGRPVGGISNIRRTGHFFVHLVVVP